MEGLGAGEGGLRADSAASSPCGSGLRLAAALCGLAPRAPRRCEFFLGRSERVLKPERASRRVRRRAAPVMEALCHSDVCNRSRWAG